MSSSQLFRTHRGQARPRGRANTSMLMFTEEQKRQATANAAGTAATWSGDRRPRRETGASQGRRWARWASSASFWSQRLRTKWPQRSLFHEDRSLRRAVALSASALSGQPSHGTRVTRVRHQTQGLSPPPCRLGASLKGRGQSKCSRRCYTRPLQAEDNLRSTVPWSTWLGAAREPGLGVGMADAPPRAPSRSLAPAELGSVTRSSRCALPSPRNNAGTGTGVQTARLPLPLGETNAPES